jgi:hypothetical protein
MKKFAALLLSALIVTPSLALADHKHTPPKTRSICVKSDGTIVVRSHCRSNQTEVTDVGLLQALLLPNLDLEGIKGDQGPAGADGAPGAKGDTGATGAQGPKGDTGATGAPGTPGAPGADGARGPEGPRGPAGSSGGSISGSVAGCASLDNRMFSLTLAGQSYTARLGDASRDFKFHSVVPGTYTVELYQFDNFVTSVGSVVVTEGADNAIGDITLADCG